MNISKRLIELEEMEVLREPLDRLHEYHNQKSLHFAGSYPRFSFEERIKSYLIKAETGKFRIELIEAETNYIIGFCIAYASGLNGKLEVLFVDEKARGKGLGKLLMNNAMEWFQEMNIDDVELTVVYGNEAASFYEKLGFYPRSLIMSIKSNS